MRLLFIVDALGKLELEGDTSYALMLEASRRGHEIWTCGVEHLGLEHDDAVTNAQHTVVRQGRVPAEAFVADERTRIPLEAFDSVWMRKDPPLDMTYLHATWILDRARESTLVVNDPRGLRELNEHLSVLAFPDLTPPTIVTRDQSRLREFLVEQGGAIVVKPIEGHGGAGIFKIVDGDPNTSSILETATENGRSWTMAQRFIPEVTQGDKRIVLIDGQPIGAVMRVAGASEARSNFHAGGRAVKTEITDEDKTIIRTIAPMLRDHGQYFVGIDVIGGRLTEINITSPTGIRHIEAVDGGNAAAPVIDWLEHKTRS
ncbi:MAG: glutathione synthase [Deltaproteobacteria bacterium]|nr:glutathione synthase [Deltaproteobacteria bacterium]